MKKLFFFTMLYSYATFGSCLELSANYSGECNMIDHTGVQSQVSRASTQLEVRSIGGMNIIDIIQGDSQFTTPFDCINNEAVLSFGLSGAKQMRLFVDKDKNLVQVSTSHDDKLTTYICERI